MPPENLRWAHHLPQDMNNPAWTALEDKYFQMETGVDRGKILGTIIDSCGYLYSRHRMKADTVQAHSRLPSVPPPRDSWFLTNGVIAAGPTPFDNVARSVAEGRVLMTQGETGREAFVIVDGKATVEVGGDR